MGGEWDTLRSTNMAMENGPGLKMYFLLKMEIFHCYVSLPEAIMRSMPCGWGEFHEIFMKKRPACQVETNFNPQ